MTHLPTHNTAWNDFGDTKRIQKFLMQLGTIRWNLESIPEIADPIPKLWNRSLHSWTSCNVLDFCATCWIGAQGE